MVAVSVVDFFVIEVISEVHDGNFVPTVVQKGISNRVKGVSVTN